MKICGLNSIIIFFLETICFEIHSYGIAIVSAQLAVGGDDSLLLVEDIVVTALGVVETTIVAGPISGLIALGVVKTLAVGATEKVINKEEGGAVVVPARLRFLLQHKHCGGNFDGVLISTYQGLILIFLLQKLSSEWFCLGMNWHFIVVSVFKYFFFFSPVVLPLSPPLLQQNFV